MRNAGSGAGLGETQHLDVAVGVAAGEHRAAADPAPDPHRLGRTVVEELHLALVEHVAAVVLTLAVLDRHRATDDPLRRDAVELTGDRTHEIAITAGGDVRNEAVGLEEAQQLDHRLIPARAVRSAELGMLRRGEELVDLGAVLFDRHVGERRGHRTHQQAQVAVVAVVVLDHRLTEPAQVVLVRRLVRLLVAQLRVGLGHLGESPQREVELDRDRLLRPQRAVVVERGDAFLWGDEPDATFLRDRVDEVDDRLPCRRVVPGCKEIFASCHGPSLLVRSFQRTPWRRPVMSGTHARRRRLPPTLAAAEPSPAHAAAERRPTG